MEASPKPEIIAIILHGYALEKIKYNSLQETVLEVYPSAKVFVPEMPLSRFSCENPNKIVNDILLKVDELWRTIDPAKQKLYKIILIGHSTGALLVRKLYVAACGQNPEAPIEPEIRAEIPREWAKNVDRLILFAGINRGWTIDPHISLSKAIYFGTGIIIGTLMSWFGFHPLAFKTRKGASFITQLRIQSLEMYKNANKKGLGSALTIQLLGTKDDLVSPEDNIDLVTGSRFVYIDIPFSGHIDVVEMNGAEGIKRKHFVKKALYESESDLRKLEIITSEDSYIKQDESVTDVVFVIHGIRDTGYWTQKIARKVKKIGDERELRKYETETSTYGYFSMGSFLIPYSRETKVEWLMDRYTENRALYPNARFSFVGHSNGTYLLAKALERYPACRFKNIVLAGSVVKQTYNWQKLIDQGRIKRVFNFVATNDWVVGIFPKTFQKFGIQDLGSGGYDGFSYMEKTAQFICIPGTHGAAIQEKVWDELAYITVHGKPSHTQALEMTERSYLMKLFVSVSPLLLAMLFSLLMGIVFLIIYYIPDKSWQFILLTGYLFLLYKVLTWF